VQPVFTPPKRRTAYSVPLSAQTAAASPVSTGDATARVIAGHASLQRRVGLNTLLCRSDETAESATYTTGVDPPPESASAYRPRRSALR
jgi:hypothetical protein